MNSAFNVVLYAVSNVELRAAFVRTILCRPAMNEHGSSVAPTSQGTSQKRWATVRKNVPDGLPRVQTWEAIQIFEFADVVAFSLSAELIY